MAIDLITYEFLKNYVATKTMGDNAIPRGTWNGSVIDYEIGNYVTHNNVVYVYAGTGHENPEPGTALENGEQNPWQEIIGAKLDIGEKTAEGGEIFNDYENNQALNTASHAEGSATTASSKAFEITTFDSANLTLTIAGDARELLNESIGAKKESYKLNNSVSFQIGNNYDLSCNIVDVTFNEENNNSIVKVSSLPTDLSKNNLPGTLWIPTNPEIGNKKVGTAAHAEGYNTKAIMIGSHTEGQNTIAAGKYSHAEGNKTVAVYGAHAEGGNTRALGHQSHAEGDGGIASGANSHVEGYRCEARGGNSHAEGSVSIAEGSVSHAAGQSNIAKGWGQSVCGRYNSPNKDSLFIVGNGTGSADTQRSNAFTVEADGSGRFKGNVYSNGKKLATTDEVSAKLERVILDALPTSNIKENVIYMIKNTNNTYTEYIRINNAWELIGNTSVDLSQYLLKADAVGIKVKNNNGELFNDAKEASGANSHAENYGTRAIGANSHAEGVNTRAIGQKSHTEGENTIATRAHQHVQGKFNSCTKDEEGNYNDAGDYAHIVGWGSSDTDRKNIHTLDTIGNAWFAGTVETIGVILTSPNGTKFKFTVDDEGNLSPEKLS